VFCEEIYTIKKGDLPPLFFLFKFAFLPWRLLILHKSGKDGYFFVKHLQKRFLNDIILTIKIKQFRLF